VNLYPIAKEKQVQANRVNAIAGAAARWEKREADATCHPVGNAVGIGFADAEGKGRIREEEGKKKEKAAPVAHLIVYPLNLDTKEFAAAWESWVAYRRERKLATLKPMSVQAQLAKLALWGHAAAVESIRQSIEQSYQGLFEPKSAGGGYGKPRPAGTSADIAQKLGYQDGM
jgi:hypothetical protein